MLSGAYRIPAIHCRVRGVYTNTGMVDAYRGAGRPEATYVVERAVDLVARQLGLDPAEVRRRNFIQPDDFPYDPRHPRAGSSTTPATTSPRSTARSRSPATRTSAPSRSGPAREGRYLGIGLSTYVEMCGVAPSAWIGTMGEGWGAGLWESANVRVHLTGKVVVTTGSQSHGQGHETTLAQLVADELGVPLEDVTVEHSDTQGTPFGYGSYGSRSAAVGAVAAHNSVQRIKDKARRIAAHMLEADARGRRLRGRPRVRPRRARRRARRSRRSPRRPRSRTTCRPARSRSSTTPRTTTRRTARSRSGRTSRSSRSTPRRARSTLQRYVAVDDVGKVINPMIVDGQVHGGIAQGVAQALWEGAVYDEDGPAR